MTLAFRRSLRTNVRSVCRTQGDPFVQYRHTPKDTSSCLNYLHRLGFAFKRPKKQLLKADEAKRESFVADAELRGKWVLKGTPALVDSTSPRYGEKASYYSAGCLETGQVGRMELEGNSNSGTYAALLNQLRHRRSGQLSVIWDNAPASRRQAQERGAGTGISQDTRTGVAVGESAGLQRGLQCR